MHLEMNMLSLPAATVSMTMYVKESSDSLVLWFNIPGFRVKPFFKVDENQKNKNKGDQKHH